MEAKGCFAIFFGSCAFSATFIKKNNCPYTRMARHIDRGGGSQLSKTGFELASGHHHPTLLEFTLNGDGGKDFYDVSNVDGFNLPASITPQGGCTSTECRSNINSVCPPELSVKDAGGNVVACKSACLALQQPQYCCTGSFNTAETCPPTNYSKIFKEACPQAYSYAYDDKSSTFTCVAGGNYDITFCP
ncbi:hypothetical protein MKX03_011170 [Papaver bracteatum]|nr:hypothetical protein MKX03_011170 [Papaver bracteatum]